MNYIAEVKDLEVFAPSYLIPNSLFLDPRFQSLSADGKILYALILDKMKETHKFGRYDEENLPYVFFPQDEVQQILGVSIARAGEVLQELDVKNGVGLIYRQSQRMGKPKRIYLNESPVLSLVQKEKQVTNTTKPTPTKEEYQKELKKQEELENKMLQTAQGGY